MYSQYSTVFFEKNPHIGGLAWFKPVLFEDQLYINNS